MCTHTLLYVYSYVPIVTQTIAILGLLMFQYLWKL